MALRVLIADDHAVVRAGLRALLAADSELDVVGEAENGDQALQLAGSLRPDTVLLDITMPPEDGIKTARRLKQEHPGLIVIFHHARGRALLHEALQRAQPVS